MNRRWPSTKGFEMKREDALLKRANKRERLLNCPGCSRKFRSEELYKAHYKQEHAK